MIGILILIQILIVQIESQSLRPFINSDLAFTISSKDTTLELPPRPLCSCQLKVLSVYNDTYSLSIKLKQSQLGVVRLSLGSSGQCLITSVNNTDEVRFDINSLKYNDNQITQTFVADFVSSSSLSLQMLINGDNPCENIEDNGQSRSVYLVNKTKQDVEGQYMYIINLPKKAIAVTQVLVFLLLLVITHNIKYRRFRPWPFNFLFAIIYAVFLFITVYIQAYIDDDLEITFWLVMAFALFCCGIYFVDILSIFLNHNISIIGLSILLCLILGVLEIIVIPDSWPVNDLIAIFVAGGLTKFVVIKKLKNAVLPLGFLWLFFIFRQIIILIHVQNFQQALQIKIVPLFLQLPALLGDDENGYICSAFGTSKVTDMIFQIITMGLVMNYCVRIDLFLSIRFYTILSSLAAFFCLTIEYLILFLADDMPVMEYTSTIVFLPLSIGIILLFSAKRGEWAQLWHGSFHDIAVDRKSIKRDSSILDEEDLDKNLQKLKMNPGWFNS